MESKRKEMHLRQKAHFERELKDRLSFLAGKGIEPPKADKDTLVRKSKANIRAVNFRLSQIAADEKRTEEMAKIKAERAAAPLKEQEGRKVEKPKKAPDMVKDKKMPAEKKAAPPNVPEGGQVRPTGGSPEEGKAPTKK
jgi:hypothetical protein